MMRMKIEVTDDSGKNWCGEVTLVPSGKQTIKTKTGSPVERKKVKPKLPDRIMDMKEEKDFFKQPQSPAEVHQELKLRGFHHDIDKISMALLRLVKKKELRRISEKVGNKTVYKYVNP